MNQFADTVTNAITTIAIIAVKKTNDFRLVKR